ncbi:MAG: hypothetical protein GC201_15460 [Alphaproteobacteria bacterium]|nr:hypothetical protein [Alphaproteobacteria bacterium]
MAEATTEEAESRGDGVARVVRWDFAINGLAFGLAQPFLKGTVRIDLPQNPAWEEAEDLIGGVLSCAAAFNRTAPSEDELLIARLIRWTAALEAAVGAPDLERGRMLGAIREKRLYSIALPTLDHNLTSRAFKAVVSLYGARLANADGPRLAAAGEELEAFLKTAKVSMFGGSNTLRLLEAAHKRRMPWSHLAGNAFVIGHGARARWIDSSFTDQTGVVGTNLARNKAAAASLLRQSGIPVPAHGRAADVASAQRIAKELGYPVVVKPMDRDGGLGVSAGIASPERLERAFNEALKISSNVLVEKHVEGRDYRLIVHDGELIWALERVPGGVTGDGRRTVRELVDAVNADPARRKEPWAPLKPLELNDEAMDLLAEAGLDGDSVLEVGRRLRLRRAANIASGGTPVAVLDKVHPVNRELAERAAKVMRLDLAGVDLLIPDISVPWTESGGAVCEVNAQPTIGATTASHLYGEILGRMIVANGRIPIALIVGAPEESPVPELVARMLAATGRRVGLATPKVLRIGGRPAEAPSFDAYGYCRFMLLSADVEAAVLSVSSRSVLASCLPFDRASVVCLAGTEISGAQDHRADLNTLMRMVLPMTWGPVVVNAEHPELVALLSVIRGGTITLAAADGDAPALAAHRDAGGATAAIEGVAGARELVYGPRRGDFVRLPLDSGGRDALACTPADIALAASAAFAVGCTPAQIQTGLGGLRLLERARLARAKATEPS